jgi:hypothetical protein
MGKEPAPISLADFAFGPNDEILACPMGQIPQRLKVGKKGGFIVHFEKARCDACPRQSDCPVRRERKRTTLRYDAKELRLARRRAKEKTAAFREVYRYRAGAEATMSDLDRVTGIKHLRVRGMVAVRVAATLKATGLNILRATAFRCGKKRRRRTEGGRNSGYGTGIRAVKERFWCLLTDFRSILPLPWRKTGRQLARAI